MSWWNANDWPTADEWQAVWAFATVLVAIGAAWLALRQYRISVRSRLEQARPTIIVDFGFLGGAVIVLEVKNIGLTAAKDIGFEWSERPIAQDAMAQEPIDRTLVNEGIAFLAPGKEMRFYFKPFDEAVSPRRYRVVARYRGSGDNEKWQSESILDLDQWAEALVDRDPLEAVTTELKAIAKSLATSVGANNNVASAAEALHLYLEEQPEVQASRERIQARREERVQRLLARGQSERPPVPDSAGPVD